MGCNSQSILILGVDYLPAAAFHFHHRPPIRISSNHHFGLRVLVLISDMRAWEASIDQNKEENGSAQTTSRASTDQEYHGNAECADTQIKKENKSKAVP